MKKTENKTKTITGSPSSTHCVSQLWIVGSEMRESASGSESTRERQPVRGKQDFPLAIASWLVYLLTGWGRGWTYGLLKHGLVVGRPSYPEGWSWRPLVPVSLNSSRLDSQSWTAVLQELAEQCSLPLPLPAAAHTPTPTLSQTQRWRGGGGEGLLAVGCAWGGLAAAGKLTDTMLLSLVPRVWWYCAEPCCWGNKSPGPRKRTCWYFGPNTYGHLLCISVQILDMFPG